MLKHLYLLPLEPLDIYLSIISIYIDHSYFIQYPSITSKIYIIYATNTTLKCYNYTVCRSRHVVSENAAGTPTITTESTAIIGLL